MHFINNYLTIGVKNSRRIAFWEDALKEKNLHYTFHSYEEIMSDRFPIISKPTTLRLSSSGENFEVYKKILALGSYPNIENLVYQKGQILPNAFWYQGYCILMNKIEKFLYQNPQLKVLNTPSAITLVFHKLKCQLFLASKGLSIPKIILKKVNSYAHLIATLEQENINEIFIKPYHGSSASGVMAFRRSLNKQVLYTTIKLKENKTLYNSLYLQKYINKNDIKTIINTIQPAGLIVEKWVRKKSFLGKSVDFRVLVIDGKATFVVPRLSNHVITNLHLGNIKGKIEHIQAEWGIEVIENIKKTAEKAIQNIPELFYAGVDIAVSSNGQVYVLEINAFGDMLLDVFYHQKNTYQTILDTWIRKHNR